GERSHTLGHLLLETRTLPRRPELRPVDGAVEHRPAVLALGAFERARNTDELARHRLGARPQDGVAVPAHVEEREVRRELGIRDRLRAREVAGLLVLETGPH